MTTKRDEHMAEMRARFYTRVQKTETCWLWTGSTVYSGYGTFSIKGKSIGAHRASYLLHHGPLEPGKLICHKCDVRNCVNPEHLYQGTYADNARDANERMRTWALSKTHCKHGHEYFPWTTMMVLHKGRPSRVCRPCYEIKQRAETERRSTMRQAAKGEKYLLRFSDEEKSLIAQMFSTGHTSRQITEVINQKFFNGRARRTRSSVKNMSYKIRLTAQESEPQATLRAMGAAELSKVEEEL